MGKLNHCISKHLKSGHLGKRLRLSHRQRAQNSSVLWSDELLGLISTGGLHLQHTTVSFRGP